MKITIPEPSDRVVSVIGVLQLAVVIGGTLFVTAMLKSHGFDIDLERYRYLRGAVFVRHYGFTLLLLPAIWAALSLLVARRASNVWLHRGIVCLGVFLILFGIYEYLALGATAMMPMDDGPIRGFPNPYP